MAENVCTQHMERWDHQENRAVPVVCTITGAHNIHMFEDVDILTAA